MATTDPIIIPVKVDKKGIQKGKDDLKGLGKAGARAGKAIGVGLKAAGIGLLIGALTIVIDLFKSWQPLIDFVNIQLAKIKAVIVTVAEAIGNFFTIGFKAFTDIGDKIDENVAAAERLERATIDLVEAQILLTAESAKLRLERAKLRLISNDESAALEDRIEAQKEAIRITQELAVLEVQQATERARILRESQAIGATRRAERLELAQLEAAISDQEIKRINEQRTLLLKLGTLQKQLDTQKIADQTRINKLLARQVELLEVTTATTLKGANITGTAQARQIEGIEQIADVTTTTTDKQTLSITQLSDLASAALTSLFGDSKEAAIANTLINTFQAITKALTIGPIAGPIFAAIIGAAGLQQVAKIQSTSLGSGGGSGGSGTGGGRSFRNTVSSGGTSINRVQASGIIPSTVAPLSVVPREIVLVTEDFNNVNDAEIVTVQTATL